MNHAFNFIRLNNGAIGYRFAIDYDVVEEFSGFCTPVIDVDNAVACILIPLDFEPGAELYLSMIKSILSSLPIERLRNIGGRIYFKLHPRSDWSDEDIYDWLGRRDDCFQVLSKYTPVELLNICDSNVFLLRTTSKISNCENCFSLGKAIGLSDEELIGVNAQQIDRETAVKSLMEVIS